MRPTTNQYKAEMNKLIREPAAIRIEFSLINPIAHTIDAFATNSAMPYSSFQHISNKDIIVDESYFTFENLRTKADGRLLIPPASPNDYLYQGYVSEVLSNGNGDFLIQPYIDVTFPDALNFPGISLTFDRVMNMHPIQLRFTAKRLGATVYDEYFDVEDILFAEVIPIKNIDNLRITFTKTQEPYQQVRVMSILYGVAITWDNEHIDGSTGVTKTADIDPLNRRLPKTELRFGVLDFERFFDIDDPKGVYEVIENRLPIEVFFGKTITEGLNWSDVNLKRWSDINKYTWGQLNDGGGIEWLCVGTFMLDASPKWVKNVAQISAQDMIWFMSGKFYKGVYQRKSLYNLALEVVADARLIPRDDGRDNIVLWNGLKNIYTDSPMPVLPQNECLRLIAHASNCAFYSDWENIIHIEPLDMTQHDMYIDYMQQYDHPIAEVCPSLFAVDSEIAHWNTEKNNDGTDKVSELHKSSVVLSGEYTAVIEFNTAVNVTVSVTGATIVNQNVYAAACELTISGTGMANILISGVKLEKTASTVRVLNIGGDENGEIETLSNALVTDRNTALAQAAYHKDWLRLRASYVLQYRGDPSVEALDLIYSQSPFTERFAARVLRHEWNFNGGLNGNMIIKNVEAAR